MKLLPIPIKKINFSWLINKVIYPNQLRMAEWESKSESRFHPEVYTSVIQKARKN